MRLGIFGGSFDPVHFGHLLLAETCREQAKLDEIQFVPTAVSPHKVVGESGSANWKATAAQRTEMLRLAIGGHASFSVSDLEVERGGISYTVDTLAAVAEGHPSASLFLLMGADSLKDLPTWRNPSQICELATPLVVRRHGAPDPNFQVLKPYASKERIAQIQDHAVDSRILELSSTEIRERVGANRSIRFQTPRAVEQYILAERLYLA